MKRLGNSRGYTLIEIVIALAILGIIIVLVLLGILGSQRSRRDHVRKQDVAQLAASGMNYAGNNLGAIAQNQAEVDQVRAQYFLNRQDPGLHSAYTITFRPIAASHSDKPPIGTIYYQLGHWCNLGPQSMPSNPTDPIAGNAHDPSKFAVWTTLESGGTATCADNN
jgi:prepilin-type N-terminal cleavage/methylation domain-containing protein